LLRTQHGRLERIIRLSGREHLVSADGRPTILLAPHFVGLDAGGTMMTMLTPLVSVYSTQKNRVFNAVLLGGRSAEREVSLSSGRGVMKALQEEGFDPVMVDPGDNHSDNNLWQQLSDAKPDAVFNALHGRFGEDGTVQGLLELMRLPYTHSGVLASALAMHKERTKDVYRAAGLPVVKSIVADRKAVAERHLMEPPYVVKPVNEGSSVGVFIIRPGDNRPHLRRSIKLSGTWIALVWFISCIFMIDLRASENSLIL